ncbi:hypothetical protein C1H46_017076 [Malus baccata]|uniref:Uncharacterized protein n=1 Tax=Malus baccata TaxID=106549 RepID=A0A540MEZ6_MALBA|nr:hypothetical protein C1H46_017076 [Malus baccata]
MITSRSAVPLYRATSTSRRAKDVLVLRQSLLLDKVNAIRDSLAVVIVVWTVIPLYIWAGSTTASVSLVGRDCRQHDQAKKPHETGRGESWETDVW